MFWDRMGKTWNPDLGLFNSLSEYSMCVKSSSWIGQRDIKKCGDVEVVARSMAGRESARLMV